MNIVQYHRKRYTNRLLHATQILSAQSNQFYAELVYFALYFLNSCSGLEMILVGFLGKTSRHGTRKM
jgi:hypothetical protein